MSIGAAYPLFTPRSGGSSGGGGGGSIRIIEGENSPVKDYESGWEYYSFGPGLSQKVFLNLNVPSSYQQGSPISIKIKWACASSSGDALIKAVATLIRAEVDAYTVTTNQRTTTNTAVTLSGSTPDELQKVSLDISSTNGQINSVSISALDAIKVEIYESSSTCADAIKWFPDLTEVTFS